MKDYDVIVIGAGSAGYATAIRSAQQKKKVLLIDEDRAGGVCLNYGCIPTKTLLYAAKTYRNARQETRFGISFGDVKVNLDKLHKWRWETSDRLVRGLQLLFRKYGIKQLKGHAEILDNKKVKVNENSYSTDYIVVATGSRPISIKGFEFSSNVWSSKQALEITHIPDTLTVIGGGVIGVEIGSIFAVFGSKVTIVEMMPVILPNFDMETAKIMIRQLKRLGIQVFTSSRAVSYNNGEVTIETPSGLKNIESEKVLVAVGRIPNSSVVKNIGLELIKHAIKTDEYRRTSIDNIFSGGDVIGGKLLAHKAHRDGMIIADVIAGREPKVEFVIPSVVYGICEMVSVGLSEEELTERGIKYKVGKFPFAANGRSLTMESVDGFVKILGEEGTDKIMGIHIIGKGVSELSGEVSLALQQKLRVKDLSECVHAHPTLSEAIMEAAENYYKRAIHILN